ncbi:SIS domain-containing protein [Mesoplasma photuris]|uniref:SIS domain-containing protein n=1 Tax=Mesoplasma photuris TaxID=217731 RepID=UPI0004E1F4F3|nr:SIS domain-containing protein [Mesoplasma photuris]
MILNFNENELKENNSFNTLNEICHQPMVWSKVSDLVKQNFTNIKSFVKDNLKKDTKIIFTGAGTSEFVGNSIYNYFVSNGLNALSISTTDITSNPLDYFNVDEDIILVSFARSGNSPESIKTYELVNSLNIKTKNVVITCNKDGDLAKKCRPDSDLLFLLPEESNDKSFAMTSSYTGMILAALLILDIDNFEKNYESVNSNAKNVEKKINEFYLKIKEIAEIETERLIFLGASNLNGIAQESHLKVLELTAGKMATFFNSPLGFRHGPKSILNDKSIVVLLMSNNEYSRLYDKDLLRELSSQKQIKKLITIDFKFDKEVIENSDVSFNFDIENKNQIFNGVNYILFAQLYAFYKSLNFGLQPDNPWPSGLVNRVVQGVILHEYKK